MSGALLAAGVAAGTLGSGIAGYLGQREANRTNVRLAREAQQWELDMWNKQNAYNTPKAQMERYREAGLNPNLIYSQGSPGLATSRPDPHVANVVNEMGSIASMNFLPILSVYKDNQLKDANISRIQSEKELIDKRIINEGIRSDLSNLSLSKGKLSYGISQVLAQTQVEAAKANLSRAQLMNQQLDWELKTRNPLQYGLMLQDYGLKKLELELNQGLKPYGLTVHDKFLYRQLFRWYDNYLKGKVPSMESGRNAVNGYFLGE